MSDKIVYTKPVHISEEFLVACINFLNKKELEGDIQDAIEDGEVPPELLTLEEVMSKPALLEYLCEVLVTCNGSEDEMHEAWNFDEFCDFAEHR